MTEFERAAAALRRGRRRDPAARRRARRARAHARWLLEEYRVSLFAQHLGTAEPVSLQRIQKALRE